MVCLQLNQCSFNFVFAPFRRGLVARVAIIHIVRVVFSFFLLAGAFHPRFLSVVGGNVPPAFLPCTIAGRARDRVYRWPGVLESRASGQTFSDWARFPPVFVFVWGRGSQNPRPIFLEKKNLLRLFE